MDRPNRMAAEQNSMNMPVVKTATATLAAYETDVEIDSSAGSAITITLQPVSEMKGVLVTLICTDYSGTVTISDGSYSMDFSAPTINGQYDGQLLYSDGRRWWQCGTRT